MPTAVFVSYRRDDSKHAAGRLGERLDERFKLFMDVDSIRPGSDFTAVVREAVEQADVLLALIGTSWLTLTDETGARRIDNAEDWVAVEIGTALRRGVPVIPVLVDGATMPGRADLPVPLADLAQRQAVRLAHESFAADSARLMEIIETVAGATRPETVDLWSDPDYPGARSALLQGQWVTAIAGLERVARRHPREPRVIDQLDQARRRQRMLDLDAQASAAVDSAQWADALDALQELASLQPSEELTQRITESKLRLQVVNLQDDMQALASAGDWAGVLAADTELTALDPEASNFEGLPSQARYHLDEERLGAAYLLGLQQLDAEQWEAGEATLAALASERPGYRDVDALLTLARRRGEPDSPKQPPPPSTARTETTTPVDGSGASPQPDSVPTPSTTGSGASRDGRPGVAALIAGVAVLLIVVGIALVTDREDDSRATSGNEPSEDATASSATPADDPPARPRALVKQVPAALVDNCSAYKVLDPDLTAGAVAALRCFPAGDNAPATLNYVLYTSSADATSAFEAHIGPEPARCKDLGPEWHFNSSPNKSEGKLTCYSGNGGSMVFEWTRNSTLTLMFASSAALNFDAMRAWWQDGESW